MLQTSPLLFAQNATQPLNLVTFILRLAGRQRQFRPGEIIPIELEFNSPIPNRFIVDNATYDRSGRLSIDDYRIEPNNAVTDPMLDYFAASLGFVGGGVRTPGVIGEKPVLIKLDLNDWFRFETPGTYTLSLVSRRVTDHGQAARGSGTVFPVESNAISFEILPADGRWEATQIDTALRVLTNASQMDRRQGCRMLRFLGTDAAADEMIRRFDDAQFGCSFEYGVGLFAVKDRARVVRQIEAGLRANRPPISEGYLRTLATLSVYVQHPEFRPAQTREAKGHEPRSGELSRHQDLIDAAKAPYAVAAAGADPAATFRELTPQRQLQLLRDEWQSISRVSMIPVLRELAEIPERADPLLQGLSDIALRRLYELAPNEGRPLILRNIQNAPRAATLGTLGALPERELPELDETLVANIELDRGGEIKFDLLQRYASRAVAERVSRYLESRIGRLACRPQAALLAYFVRTNDSLADGFIDRALATRQNTGCYRTVLSDISRMQLTSLVMEKARAHLDDPDTDVVVSSVETLGRDDSAASRALLLNRFRRWHEAWRDREAELRYDPLQRPTGTSPMMIEHALVAALGRGQISRSNAEELLSPSV